MALRELIASFGVEVDDNQVKKATGSIDNLIKGIKHVATAFAGLKVGTVLFDWVSQTRDAGDEIAKASVKLGVGTQALQAYRYAADLAGVSNETLSGALGILSKNAVEAAEGSESMQAAFRKVGISVKDSAGQIKDPIALLEQLATGMDGMKNPTEKTALAMSILGKSGKELLPFFEGGAPAIRAATEEFKNMGAAISDDLIKESVEANDNISRMNYSFLGLRNKIAAMLIPALNWLVQGITKVVTWFQKATKGTKIVQTALGVLGAIAVAIGIKIAVAFAPAIIAFTLVAAGIAAVILLIEDLYQLFTGGKSLIGDFIDALFGVGAAADGIAWLKNEFAMFVDDLKYAYELAKDFFGFMAGPSRKEIDKNTRAVQGSANNAAAALFPRDDNFSSADPVRGPRKRLQANQERTGMRQIRAMPSKVMRENPTSSNSTRNVTVAPNTTNTVNIHASGTDARAVAAIVKKEIKTADDKQLKAAMAYVGQ